MSAGAGRGGDAGGLRELIQELLAAHLDTAELAVGLAPDPDWAAHLDYLRALCRRGTELLAGEVEVRVR